MRLALSIFACLGMAVTLGLASAWLAVRSPAPIDAITLGRWQAWPNAGTDKADPYSKARLARTGEIPLGSGEGLMLLAQTDDSGEPLRAGCDYRIEGQTPPARLWTVAVEDRSGRIAAERDRIAALGSDVLLRLDDGSFAIRLSPRPQSGNWISTASVTDFRIVIRLYDTTARIVTALTTLAMPRILREHCA